MMQKHTPKNAGEADVCEQAWKAAKDCLDSTYAKKTPTLINKLP